MVNTTSCRTILIYRIGKLGDTLIAIPAIQAIRNKYPDHQLILLTERHKNKSHYISSWDVLGPTGWFDNVIIYEVSSGIINKINISYKLYKQLSYFNITCTYNLSPDRSPFQRKRDKVFFKNILGVPDYTDSKPFIPPKKDQNGNLPKVEPEWARLLYLVQKASLNIDYKLPIPQGYKEEASAIMHHHGITHEQDFIALGPGSKMPAKRWPTEYYLELCHHIIDRYPDITVIVFGGKEDEDVANILCTELEGRAHNLAGKLSIYGAAALLERCQIYVGNDTGTMHLAASVGLPCVAIFSARDYPGKWEPFGQSNSVLRNNIICSGCMLDVCDKSNECIRNINVMDVERQVDFMFHENNDKVKTT